eukprot:jgi/Bigna1/73380/fgenesh1_pg.24_\
MAAMPIPLLLMIVTFAAAFADFPPCQEVHKNGVEVELNVLSGTRDPSVVLTASEWTEVCDLMDNCEMRRPCRVMGYTGFRIDGLHDIYGCRDAELKLASKFFTNISEEVALHVAEEIIFSDQMDEESQQCFRSEKNGVPTIVGEPQTNCKETPVVGPDSPAPEYSPKSDDGGCFITEQRHNNCYNYGNDVVTNTFAQPGRGSGEKWKANTCEDVRAAAERDGLVWHGNDAVPTAQPEEGGHFVALLIWPKTNFHWIRMDRDLFWSHKPGQTAVRNVDNTGSKITDPSKSDFSPWTQFCGYFRTVPSNTTLN